MQTITILRSHIDDFKKHPGWWASFDNPNLVVGEQFEFVLDDLERHIAICDEVLRPGQAKPFSDDFQGWWAIRYHIDKESEKLLYGDTT